MGSAILESSILPNDNYPFELTFQGASYHKLKNCISGFYLKYSRYAGSGTGNPSLVYKPNTCYFVLLDSSLLRPLIVQCEFKLRYSLKDTMLINC